MKLFFWILLFCLTSVFSLVSHGSSCMDNAQTQTDMNSCAYADLVAANKELNQVYKQVQAKYSDDGNFLARLKDAQRAWITFRDAQFKMKYPHSTDRNYYGSAFSMCAANYLADLTWDRVKTLKIWLNGSAEGDVCAGSVGSSN